MNPARMALFTVLATLPAAANAGMMMMTIPTLGEWGMIGLSAGVGSLGAWMVSRKKK